MPTLEERFWRHVSPEPMSGCWLWTANLGRCNGYGTAKVGRRPMLAHRLSWQLHRGPIPRGEGYHGTCVLHRCDVRNCVNPDHLFLGTNADNVADKERKGRANQPKGERHWKARLTAADVLVIRARRAAGETLAAIARDYAVHPSTVVYAARGATWRAL